jgi:dienelactone hydrolase
VFFSVVPQAFAARGIATILLDTFTPRGVSSTVYDQTRVSVVDMSYDALALFARIRSDARFRPGKIALMGHSKGGLLAVGMASAAWYAQLGVRDTVNFDAAIALSPDCSVQSAGFMKANPRMQFLAVMGERDDYTLPGPCVTLMKKAQAEGAPVDFVMIPKAIHSFSRLGHRWDGNIYTLNGCANDPLVLHAPDRKLMSLSGAKEVAFAEIVKHCEKRGASVGGEREAVPEVVALVGDWLKARGW